MNWYLDVLKNYAVFEGRARRMEYWMFTLWNTAVALLLFLIGAAAGGQTGFVLNMMYAFAVLPPSLAVAVRRLHDTDRSGWWLCLVVIPFVGSLVLLVFLVTDSQPGTNQFGPNPKGEAS
jgi:uncharacterized membrane protein YhaH (DUF805 family)